MSTPEQEADQDLIAALIDGRLTPAERERALQRLAESDSTFELFAESLRVTEDLRNANVVPIKAAPSARRRRLLWIVAPALAAALLLIAVFPLARLDRSGVPVTASTLVRPLTARPDLQPALGLGWERRNWSVTRGETTTWSDTTIAFRLGVRAADLQVAIAVGDQRVAGELASEMASMLRPVPLSESVVASYSDLQGLIARGGPREAVARGAATAEDKAARLLGSYWFRFGIWSGGAELAARTNSAAFFESAESSRFIDDASGRGGLADEDIAVLRQVAAMARDGVSSDELRTLRELLQQLVRRHGG